MSRWKIFSDSPFYFVTTTITEWQNVFCSTDAFEIIINSLKYCIANKGLHLHGYVIMPNHAHYILSTNENKKLSDIMRDFNTHTSRLLTKLLTEYNRQVILNIFKYAASNDRRDNVFKVWQDGYHPIVLMSEIFLRQKLDYLHNNPVRKGFVEKPEEWRYSSERNYIHGDHSIIQVECLN